MRRRKRAASRRGGCHDCIRHAPSGTVPGLLRVELHPDGEHAKRFEIAQWLNARGFSLRESHGTTAWGGTYVSGEQVIAVTSIPGKGDVVALTTDGVILGECKGGIINTVIRGKSRGCAKDFVKPSDC